VNGKCKVRRRNCNNNNQKISGTQACQQHAEEWDKHVKVIAFMELEDCCKDLERIYLGSQLLITICNHMIKRPLKHTEEIISPHLVSTVWKQYVLHVA
jgi:hypothetical protein